MRLMLILFLSSQSQRLHFRAIFPLAVWSICYLRSCLRGSLVRSRFSDDLDGFDLFLGYLLLDPTSALGNPEAIDGPMTSNFFEAKRDNVRAAIPQAVMAVASHCTQHGYVHLRMTYIMLISFFN